MALSYGSSLAKILLNVSLLFLIFRKEKLQRECLVAKEEKVVIRGENQKRELCVISSHHASRQIRPSRFQPSTVCFAPLP